MRPADSHPSAHPVSSNGATGPIHSTESARTALGAVACACCHDTAASPTLAGDRARGPDHLYLVCDRCGASWQRVRIAELGQTADGPADVRLSQQNRDGLADLS